MMPLLCCNNRFFNIKPVLALRVHIFYSITSFPNLLTLFMIHDNHRIYLWSFFGISILCSGTLTMMRQQPYAVTTLCSRCNVDDAL